jgi:hypothetical protein
VVEKCRLFCSIEYPSGQLSEVPFESPVGGPSWVDHRGRTATSTASDCCFLVDWVNCKVTERIRRRAERTPRPDLPTKLVWEDGVFISWCSSQIPVISR